MIRKIAAAGMIIFTICMLEGCGFQILPEEEVRREAKFVIVSEDCVPGEVKALIESRKKEEIKLTYVEGEDRYIIIGYGEQKTGGYSIYINEFYATENALYVDTTLMGPKAGTKPKEVPSYPVIVLRTPEASLPVVFN